MNVLHAIPIVLSEWNGETSPQITQEYVTSLLRRREEVYHSFLMVEKSRGFLSPVMSLSHSTGQEGVRILIMRMLEELLEARHAHVTMHAWEELIDAVNYLWSIPIGFVQIDQSAASDFIIQGLREAFPDPPPRKAEIEEVLRIARDQPQSLHLSLEHVGDVLHEFLETLRNRAWQNSPQSLYFDGLPQVFKMLCELSRHLAQQFPSSGVFFCLFEAKELVLRFRISSQY